MEVGVGIGAVAFDRFVGAGQIADRGVMHDEAELLLRASTVAQTLALLRQERAANQWPEFFVAGRHLLQWRIGIGEPE